MEDPTSLAVLGWELTEKSGPRAVSMSQMDRDEHTHCRPATTTHVFFKSQIGKEWITESRIDLHLIEQEKRKTHEWYM